jgi:hypothetical protein
MRQFEALRFPHSQELNHLNIDDLLPFPDQGRLVLLNQPNLLPTPQKRFVLMRVSDHIRLSFPLKTQDKKSVAFRLNVSCAS